MNGQTPVSMLSPPVLMVIIFNGHSVTHFCSYLLPKKLLSSWPFAKSVSPTPRLLFVEKCQRLPSINLMLAAKINIWPYAEIVYHNYMRHVSEALGANIYYDRRRHTPRFNFLSSLTKLNSFMANIK